MWYNSKRGDPKGLNMGKFWPFNKKKPEPEGQKVVTYTKDENSSEELLSDRSHIEDDQYKAALDLLTKPHLGSPESGNPSTSEVVENENTGSLGVPTYIQSDDGYWYILNDDGSYNPTAYIKNDDGSYSAYS